MRLYAGDGMTSAITATVPARPDYVRVLRLVVGGVAARLNLPYDQIDDLRMAVDEACAHLLSLGSFAQSLTLRMVPLTEGIEVVVAIDSMPESWPPADGEETLAWRVLRAIVDEARYDQENGAAAIRFAKRVGEDGVAS